jgi:hypothetical protein
MCCEALTPINARTFTDVDYCRAHDLQRLPSGKRGLTRHHICISFEE